MTDQGAISAAIASTMKVTFMEAETRVRTQCLYPSNGAVILTIRGGLEALVVSDDARAVAEVHSYGLSVDAIDRHFKRLIRNQGLKVRGGAIYSPPVAIDALGPAVLLVANASRDAAHWCLDHFKFPAHRHFKRDLADLLERHYKAELRHQLPIVGESNKPHKFDHVLTLPGDRQLLIDPVLRDANSINSRVVANLDVQNRRDPLILQRIVYDDTEEWSAADLSLLRIGAPIVPFSRAPETFQKLIAA